MDFLAMLWPPLLFLLIYGSAALILGGLIFTEARDAIRARRAKTDREAGRVHTGVLPTVPMPAMPAPDDETFSQFAQEMHESIMRLLAECEAAAREAPEEMHIDVFLSRVDAMPNYLERVRMGALWLDSGYETLDGLEQAMKEQYGE